MNRPERAEQLFQQGTNCAQAVACSFAEDLGADRQLALRMATGFGGGMGHTSNTCGALTGAVMALGLAFGMKNAGDQAAKDRTYALVAEAVRRFRERAGAIACTDLLGFDLSIPEQLQAVRDRGLTKEKCPGYVKVAAEIVEQLLREQ
jgi:C_GCAxxG_C_C family probable redox protein